MKYKYNEKKGFFDGVPARDLTVDEFQGLNPEIKAAAEATGLFSLVDEEPATTNKKSEVKNG